MYLHLHIQPSELEHLEYYEYHYLIKDLTEHLKKESDANKGQQDATGDMMSKMKMPNIKMPNMRTPSLK